MPTATCDVYERIEEPAADSAATAFGGYGDRQFRYVGRDEAITTVVDWKEPEPGSPDRSIVFADHPGVAGPSPAAHVAGHEGISEDGLHRSSRTRTPRRRFIDHRSQEGEIGRRRGPHDHERRTNSPAAAFSEIARSPTFSIETVN